MSYRVMRIMIFFDLPTITYNDKRSYTLFRRFLIKNGFLMLQESVYSKLVLNQIVCEQIKDKIKKFCPSSGLVQMLVVTEKQYAKIEYLAGKNYSKVENSDKRLIIV